MAEADELKIVNAARAHFGAWPLADFAETTLGGVEAKLLYDAQRLFLLGFHPWQFTRTLVQLSRIADAVSDAGYAYVFQTDPGMLGSPERLTDNPRDAASTVTDYLQIGGQIHCDSAVLFAHGQIDSGPAGWPSSFREAFRAALTADFALALASDRNAYAELRRVAFGAPSENMRGGLLGAAIQQDARTSPTRRINTGRNPMTAAWSQ